MGDMYNRGGGALTPTSVTTNIVTADDLEVDAGTLSIDATNNRIGVGTILPGTQLQVEGATPYVTLKNDTAENTAGGCESKILFEDHGNNALGQIEVSHVGTSDDEKAQFIIKTNNDSGLQTALTIDEAQQVIVGEGKLVLNATAVTSTAAELNLLDGVSGLVQADLTKLAAIDASAAEINAAADASARTVAAVVVADDHFLFADGGATGDTKVESIADLMTAVAGTVASTGLSASSGVLSVTDLHPVGVSGAANQLITDDGDGTVTSEANLSFDGSTLAVTGALSATTTALIGTNTTVGTAGNTTGVSISTVINTGTYVGKALTIAAGDSTTGGNNLNGGDLILKAGGGDGTGTSAMLFQTKVNGTDIAGERMRIHTDGNIGMGDNAPGTLLQMKGTAPYITLQNSTAENSEGGCEGRILFEDHGNNPLAQVEGSHTGTADDEKGQITFSTNNDSGLQAGLTINDTQQVIVGEGKLVLGTTAVTSTAAELNLLDNVAGLIQGDFTKLANLNATAAEINAIADASARPVAAVDVSADHFGFFDGAATGAVKAESIADLMTGVAGTVATTGLAASSGTLVVSDLHPVGVSGAANQLLTDDGDGTVTSEAKLLCNGTTVTIGDATAEDTMLVFDGNAQDFRIGLDDGTDRLEFGVGTTHGTTTAFTIASPGLTSFQGSVSLASDISFNENVADTQVSGITAFFTAGEALVAGECVYFKAGDSKMWKAVATAAATSRCVAMATQAVSADAGAPFLLQGFLRIAANFPSYTIGGALYTPEAETAGENVPEQAAPADAGDFIQVIGWAVTADAIYFNPGNEVIGL